MLLNPSDPRAPRYWMYETSGVLKPVIKAYLEGSGLTPYEVGLMRDYLRQWVSSPVWQGGTTLEQLVADVEKLTTREDIDRWLEKALELGMDPL